MGWGVETPVVLAQEFTKYTEECQAISFFPKHHKATAKKRRVGFDKERAAAELGTVLAVCFPGFG